MSMEPARVGRRPQPSGAERLGLVAGRGPARGRRTAEAPVPLLVAVLVGVLAGTAGCGRTADRGADAPVTASGSPSPLPSQSPSGAASESAPAGAGVTVAILVGTVAGGSVDPTPAPLDSPAAVAVFVAQFSNDDFVARIEREAAGAEVAPGRTLVGGVLAIGCDVPKDVQVIGAPGSIRLLPVMPKKRRPTQCFAPMTSVGLVDVSDSLLGAPARADTAA